MAATAALSPLVERVPLSRLTPAPWNPRLIRDVQFKSLVRSIEQDPDFMLRRPILATADGTIYAGNMRYRAVASLGWESVPAIVEDVDEVTAKARAVRDNNGWGEWQDEELAELLHGIGELGGSLDDLGFDSDKLAELLGLDTPVEGLTDPDEIPEVGETPYVKLGDIWQLGEHRVMCGDSLTDLDRLLSGAKPDMVWSDPPYGLGGYAGRSGKYDPVQGDDAEVEQLLRFFAVGDAPEVYVCCEYRTYPHLLGSRGEPRSLIVWAKPHFGMGNGYRRRHEFVGYYGSYSGTTDSDLWEEGRENDHLHPTQKPVALPNRAIRNSTERGALVLDPFLGSGTTLISAHVLGRVCFGMEIDPRYAQVSIERWQRHTGQQAQRIEESA